MRNLAGSHGPNLRCFDGYDCSRVSVQGDEFYFVSLTVSIHMDNVAHVSGLKTFVRDGRFQYDSFMFPNHRQIASQGYAVTSRGFSLPLSTIHTVRTVGLFPEGVLKAPSTIYLMPWEDSILIATSVS